MPTQPHFGGKAYYNALQFCEGLRLSAAGEGRLDIGEVKKSDLVIFEVKVRTAFYVKFMVFISALNNGALHMIQKERSVMTRALLQELFLAVEVLGTAAVPGDNFYLPPLLLSILLGGSFLSCCCAAGWISSGAKIH